MRKSWIAVLAALALAAGGAAAPAAACEEEGPGFVMARVDATLAPEDAARIVVEKYDGTLAVKGIVLRGTARWTEGSSELVTGPVTVEGTYLTTGDETTALENRGILWLKYAFADAAGAPIGTGEGFVTLERVAWGWGAASFQGTITVAGVARQFAGLGWTALSGLLPPLLEPPPEPARVGCEEGGCGEGAAGIVQEMVDTVITGAKPGFEFESARTVTQLDKQFQKAEQKLTRERDRRRKVIRSVR